MKNGCWFITILFISAFFPVSITLGRHRAHGPSSALCQLPNTPDVPKHSAKGTSKGEKGTRRKPKRPGVKQKGGSAQASQPRSGNAQPAMRDIAKSNSEPLATKKQAESTVIRALDTTIDANALQNFRAFPGSGIDPPLSFGNVNSINLIVDKHKAFVETFNNQKAQNIIIKELKKYPKLQIVATREEADFIISYTDKQGSPEFVPGNSMKPNQVAVPTPVGRFVGTMTVYTLGEKRTDGIYQKNVVWSDGEDQDKIWFVLPTGKHPATNVTRNFLKALKKLRGESK